MEAGFDNSLYIHKQTEHIRQRIAQWGGKLYLEFGGKLFDDYHAARVLPGFDPNGKIRLLYEMREQAEIIFTVSAGDIEKTKMRADLGISYDMEVLRLIDDITHMGIRVNSVVITQYTGQAAADGFAKKLTMRGVKNYIHRPIKGYPTDIAYICSDEGYGANPYIETSRPLVVVTAPGPGSGKLATCLSQVYHEIRQGRVAGYAKFETFPIWNLPLKHPVNLAYEAATADLADVNMIDPFHLEAYGVTTVNYNRDVEAFPIVRNILSRITGDESVYKSPTDMGVNMAGYAIVDDEAVRAAASQEIAGRGGQNQAHHAGAFPHHGGPCGGCARSCQKRKLRRGRRGHPAAGRTDRNGQGQQPDERLLLLRAQRHQGHCRHRRFSHAHQPHHTGADPQAEDRHPRQPFQRFEGGRRARGALHHSRHQHADGPRHGRAAEAAGLRDAQHLHAAFR